MQIKFQNGRSLLIFRSPLKASAISFVNQPLQFSEKLLHALNTDWELQLIAKQQQLNVEGIASQIKSYGSSDEDASQALYVNDRPVLFPGKTITLQSWTERGSGVELAMSEVTYPFIGALNNKEFREKISTENIPQMRPPLAVCTFAITTDQHIVLTQRGVATNVYPGRFYGQGGNPSTVNFDLAQHQTEEMEEEVMIHPHEISEDGFHFFGIMEDEEIFRRKPDLVGAVKIQISSAELKSRFHSRPPEHRPADVADICMIPFNPASLENFLLNENKATNFCPPAYGGLLLLGFFEFGENWLKKILSAEELT